MNMTKETTKKMDGKTIRMPADLCGLQPGGGLR